MREVPQRLASPSEETPLKKKKKKKNQISVSITLSNSRVEQPQMYQDKLNRHIQEAQQEQTSPLAGGGRRRHSTAATERKFSKNKNRDHQRRWPAAKIPKASHPRREREENRQAEQKKATPKMKPKNKS